MREIKFRAWDKNKQIMTDKPFIIGNKKSSNKYFSTLHSPNIYTKELIWMQYTGLKDKNGKEIYEGDMVKIPRHGVIEVEDLQDFFETKGYEELEMNENWIPSNLEIIGNIYENSELLK